uniref:Uncharacterized protein n=1 Tax=Brassica oleracea var. oleracea TaxID=109376 RepID=A0A0D3BUK3_BRAOL
MGKGGHDSGSGKYFAIEKTFHKGPWTSAEDQLLIGYVDKHGEGNWNAVQKHSGLSRCGKSCRLRWVNHLRPSLKKGSFTDKEEQRVVELHASMGNKWARMAAQLPGRTDNEIKNFWNTRLKKLQRLGLPIYPDEVREQAMNAAAQNGQNSDHSQESLEPDCLEIPEFDFKYLQLNNYQSVLLRNVPMGNMMKHCSFQPNMYNLIGSPYMSPNRKRVREQETDFLDTGDYATNEQSAQLWNQKQFHVVPESHLLGNATTYSSPPSEPEAEKLELPSFQCFDPPGDWETQHSNPMPAVESDRTLVQSPLTDCPSSGLLESVVYGSSGEKQATNSTDPDSPLLLQSSLFGHIELTPAFENNTETDMFPFGPTSSSERGTSLESGDWIRQLLGEDRDYTNDNRYRARTTIIPTLAGHVHLSSNISGSANSQLHQRFTVDTEGTREWARYHWKYLDASFSDHLPDRQIDFPFTTSLEMSYFALPEYHIDLISESSGVALLELSRSIRRFLRILQNPWQRGSETSGLALLLVRACGAETFVPWTLLERAGASCLFMLELNFHSGSSIYSNETGEYD